MTFNELLAAACGKIEMPPFPTLPERMCFAALRNVRCDWLEKRIDDKQAAVEKRDIRRAYDEAAEAHQQHVAVYRTYCQRSKQAGGIIRDIVVALKADSPDYKALLEKAMDCIGVLCNEHVSACVIRDQIYENGGNHAENM